VCSDCQVDKCLDCFNSGIDSCDRCEKGQHFDGGKCSDCDDFEDTVICSQCTGLNQCTKCNLGYRLGFADTEYEGKCLTCDDGNCDVCDRAAGTCQICKPGFWLDETSLECVACQGNSCLECSGPTTCSVCDERRSVLRGGKCVCKTWDQWYYDSEQENSCLCGNDYIDVEGMCVGCNSIIEGCGTCGEKAEQDNNESFVYLGEHEERPD